MRTIHLLFIVVTLAGCGLKHITDPLAEESKSTDCVETYTPSTQVQNWTGSPIQLEMSYKVPSGPDGQDEKRLTVPVVLGVQGAAEIKLPIYQIQRHWGFETSCSQSYSYTPPVQLHLTPSTF